MRWRSRGTAAATWASWRRSPWVLLALGGVLSTLLLAGCRDDSVLADPAPGGDVTAGPSSSTGSLPDDGETTPGTAGSTSYAVAAPGPLRARLFHADVLVRSGRTLPDALVERVRGIRGVQAVLPISLAQTSVEGRTLDVAAVDPAAFRRYTPEASARANFVWKRLAGGEVVVDIDVSRKLVGEGDVLRLGTRDDSPEVHVGAYAPLVQQARGVQTFPAISAVVNVKRGAQLGIPEHNALLVSTGDNTPSSLEKEFDRALGDRATLQVLAREFDLGPQTAVLSGVSVTDAVGTFDYRDNGDGTITPNPAWVQEYIRTEQVPILGSVTCNKGMLPQLRGALEEIVRSGLGDKIHPDEYAGCYYPRYIGRDPSNGLSLHSWGIAVDLNVPGNQRGTVGEIDRRVVAIFKRWGFAWGGDWNYTDPMHFEMNRVVRAR